MSEMNTIKDKKDTNILQKDIVELSYIYQKAERLVSGLYVVTELIKDTEPIKWKLRDIASRLVTDMRENALDSMVSGIETIISLLRVAGTTGLVSEMNFKLLSTEYSGFEARIKNGLNSISAGAPLPSDFFDIPEVKTVSEQIIRNHVRVIKKMSHEERVSNIPGPKGGDRRTIILDYLRGHPESTIKDVFTMTNLGKECSEKTIQRELVALVEEGVISRSGERRWSKYSFKS
jgi:hypothetical protein